ncbi:MAG: aminotransferase class V-fold PLP-dependent enzyme [Anaerolineales bacterium]|nr:aminotransferase class V-fold PLP-dependent enzyme [Anaerolineales bacterium]
MSHRTIELQQDYAARLAQALAYQPGERERVQVEFARSHGGQAFAGLAALRRQEYGRLDAREQVYLDYTGGGLYAQSQLDAHMAQLAANVYGNPHSSNPTSMAATKLVDQARDYVRHYFNADPAEYAVIFTANASGALKLLGESYPFEQDGQYLLTFDNHNSVNGIREYAVHHNARVQYAPISLPDLGLNEATMRALLTEPATGPNRLFAFPAQSNFSGVQHDLAWVNFAREQGWDVLLDCAAYVPTNRLDLAELKPDFVPLSFYKMFGYPTGLGALLARRETLRKLRRPWFAGGTVEMVSAMASIFARASDEAAFEDGTISYLQIPAVEIGLRHLEKVGIDQVHERVAGLTGYMLEGLHEIRHSNGEPVVLVYGPQDMTARGGTIAFNLLDPQGNTFDVLLVETLANQAQISLRTGCFCNPGAGENVFNLTIDDVTACSSDLSSLTFDRYIAALTERTGRNITGAVRVSLGIASNAADVYHFLKFLRTFVDLKSPGFMHAVADHG